MAIASCISYSPLLANAASLGKLTVLSGLGQPLRAELELGAAADELGGMTARLAPADAFKQAGVDYVSALSDLRFIIDKRPGGQSVVKVSSSKPVNEAFLDFLVELNWPTGRLVREYTFLLDPPEMGGDKQAVRSIVDARVVETVRTVAPAASRAAAPTKAASVRTAPAEKAENPEKKAESTAESRVVQRGDTLRKIAGESQYDGVSLEQMLVGLFRNNPDAFVGKNINRLKAGAILNIPGKSEVEAVTSTEARKIAVSHAGDWGAYRQKLAAATAKGVAKDETEASQVAKGKITARVDEKAFPVEKNKDQVKVARNEGGGSAEDRLARDKALKEAQERVVALEKNVGDLQKLLEVKNQKLSELQQAPARKDEPKPVEPAKQEVAKPAEVKAAEPKAPEAVKPAEEAKAVEPAKPVEVAPPPPPPAPPPAPVKKPLPPPPPPPEPDLVESLLEDPLPLAAGGGVLALLAGGLVYMRRRRQQSAFQETTATPMSSSLGPNSVFRMTGGQSVDTGNTPPQTGDFSQTGPGTIDTDEVDPVAEADVYMAYGRDTQAEEILLEALQKDPQRTAIHAKLLEIYANRGSLKQFETLASELYAQTGGVGQDWAKVAALGARLDPRNPLYSGDIGAASGDRVSGNAFAAMPDPVIPEPVASFATVDTELEVPAPVSADAMTLDFDIEPPPLEVPSLAAGGEHIDTSYSDSNVLDFDLGTDISSASPVADEPVLSLELPPASSESGGLDFDLGKPAAVAKAANQGMDDLPVFSQEDTLVVPVLSAGADQDDGLNAESAASLEQATAAALDFDFELPESPVGTASSPLADLSLDAHGGSDMDHTATVINVAPPPVDDELEFDVSLGDSVFMGQPMPSPEFDIGSIDLDLSAPVAAGTSSATVRDERWEDVNTKLDLAKAYEEMGDQEGARELLNEVIAEGLPDLAEQAKAMLGRFKA